MKTVDVVELTLTEESWFFEPPTETEIGSKNR